MFEQCLYFNTTALARRLEREWSRAFAPFGLTPAQAFMLRAILAEPGPLQGELAALLGIARPTATRTLDGLVEKGLVVRQSSAEDGRECRIHPTAAAQALTQPLNEASAAVTRRLQATLGKDRFGQAVQQLRQIREALP